MLSEERVERAIEKAIFAAAVHLPPDVEEALRRAHEEEDNPVAKSVLRSILSNVEVAREEGRPLCQDTGTVIFYVRAGERFPLLGRLPSILKRATVRATASIPLRPNSVDVITEENSGDNTGDYIPWLEWEVGAGEDAEVTVVLKGGGSEAPGLAVVLSPAAGVREALRLAVNAIYEAGPGPCPPVIVGVGMGPTTDAAMKLAKKALLRPMHQRNPRPEAAELELKLLRAINALGWGPHGVGGRTTALDARIEMAHRHPGTLAVGVAINCWAARQSTIRLSREGVEFVTHPFLSG